jgi:hypothetical protein
MSFYPWMVITMLKRAVKILRVTTPESFITKVSDVVKGSEKYSV